MLTLTPTEIRVLRVWSESGERSPFPKEATLARRIKESGSQQVLKFSTRELEIILHWAEIETRGHHGLDQFLLDQEEKLLLKIETYLAEQGGGAFGL
jgi:hypothetical protein